MLQYRTGGGRRLYMISSADARTDTEWCPNGVVRDQPDGIVRYTFQTKIVRCLSDVSKRRPGAVRAPYGSRPMSFYTQ